jgi:hypothetical protein
MMTPRERNRLRSERWRRAHGIGPRKPAQRPWLEAGCSRSTWYRRRKQAREATARQCATAATERTFTRAERFVAELRTDLDKAARSHAVAAAIIGELVACPF